MLKVVAGFLLALAVVATVAEAQERVVLETDVGTYERVCKFEKGVGYVEICVNKPASED